MGNRLQRVLVLFSTVSGCTESIARRIGADLIAYGVRPTVASVAECPELIQGQYDAVIMGSGVRIGRWHKDAREWVQRNKAALSTLPRAFFAVGLHGVKSDGRMEESVAREDLKRVMATVGIESTVEPAFLSGWKRQDGFSGMERMALRVYPLADGDYRDWDAVDAWVKDIAPSLVKQATATAPGAVASTVTPLAPRRETKAAAACMRQRTRTPRTVDRGGRVAAYDGMFSFEECRA